PRFEPGEGRERSGERATGAVWGRSPTPLQPILAVIGLIFALGRMGHPARGPLKQEGQLQRRRQTVQPASVDRAPPELCRGSRRCPLVAVRASPRTPPTPPSRPRKPAKRRASC